MRFLAVITLLILALTLEQPVAAQSFKPDSRAGRDAYEQKDYATALKHFRPHAKQGYARAQVRLGRMYRDGVNFRHKPGITRPIPRPVRIGLTAPWIVMPLFSNARHRLSTFSFLVIDGVNLTNAGLLLFSSTGEYLLDMVNPPALDRRRP